MPFRTICQAIEDASKAEPTRGYRFIPDTGVPGYDAPGADLAAGAEASFSYTAVERMTARFGGALQALGLRKGDRVALILPNNDDFVLCFLGALRAGIVPVPIYPPMALGQLQAYLDNTRHIVHKSGARALVTTSKIKRLLGTVQAECPDLEQVVAIEGIRESTEPLKPEKIGLDDVAFLQFTSGSTSRPKGVTLTHANLAANIVCIMEHGLKIRDDDVAVSWLPLYHDMGLIGFVLAPIFHRTPVHFLPALMFLKRPVTWLQAFTRVGGTIAYAPNFAYALVSKRLKGKDVEDLDLSCLRVSGCGAEPIQASVLREFAATLAPARFDARSLLSSYGMAESTLAITFTPLGQGTRADAVDAEALTKGRAVPPRAGSREGCVRSEGAPNESHGEVVDCGRAFPGHELAIIDGQGRRLEDRRVGQIVARGPSVSRGYFREPALTAETFKAIQGDTPGEAPWLHTGDLGYTAAGRLFVCGRVKDLIIIRGRNYYPSDIEWAVTTALGEASSARKGNVVAFSVRVDARGRASGAGDAIGVSAIAGEEHVVICCEGHSAEVEAIREAATAVLASRFGLTVHEVVVAPLASLPRTSSGKPKRRETRQRYLDGSLPSARQARQASGDLARTVQPDPGEAHRGDQTPGERADGASDLARDP